MTELHSRRRALFIVFAVGACSLSPLAMPPDPCAAGTDWPMSGHDICNRRTAADSKISPASAPKLGVKWVYDAAGDVSATPAVVAGSVYVPDWGGNVSRLDAATGKPIWSKPVADMGNLVDDKNVTIPGIVSRTTPTIVGGLAVIGTQRTVPYILAGNAPGAFMIAVDTETGTMKWKTPVHDGHPAAVVTGSPVVDEGRLYFGVSSLEEAFGINPSYKCCSFRGSVVALDAATGKIVWQSYTIDDATFYAKGTKDLAGYAGASVWSSTPVIDKKRHSLYVTTGNNYLVPKGVTEIEGGNHADSIMALDLDTGAVKWSVPLTHPVDVWTFQDMEGPDYDFGCGANLFTVGGRDLVGAGQKSGTYYALDADSGELVWKTSVGPGGHLGGIHWGTAVDADRIYAGVNNETHADFKLSGKGEHGGETVKVGAWSALDPATGEILWQTPNPKGGLGDNGSDVNGPVTVANGVVFVGSMDPKGSMFALDAATGAILWSFESGGTVYGGPAIVDGVIYWGAGYPRGRLQFGSTINKLYAFEVKP